ncbi:putative component of the lipoprotein assembly complex (forms a complex with YaeT, YfgL, and NlpB) [Nitrincola lacisaponensis]|uniref:Outer membrane protein assembly factor BamD n=1 Tax=Nitrincola lacisaponensis TaxID=267850 RepID=A0A063Y0C0_9GAMM|nr:outer membrane protein assembly factor BamD [Nitrincola lacisaponensis]KDE39778.1 putative component of the lipoprotein assembly complex (forms a complex with YaeT, YfgL, and NlpB) [Nitrincola lacisaponensis]
MQLVKVIGALTLLILLSGCSWFGGDKTIPDIPEQILYDDAMSALDAGNWSLAIEKLQLLEARYPFGRFSEQAQLELIYAYYRNSEPAAARAAADRFVRLHPNHDHIDYAYYLKGLTSFEEDRNFLARFLPLDETQRDPGAALDSFESFSILLNRYPDSEFAPDAQRRMQYLKNRLATYEIHVASYYMKREAWVAAANRGRYVVENLQETPAVPDALAIMAESYTKLGMHDLAENALEVLRVNFPDYVIRPFSPQRFDLLYTATFGLLGQIEPATPARPVNPDRLRQAEADGERNTSSGRRSLLHRISFGTLGSDGNEQESGELIEQAQ